MLLRNLLLTCLLGGLSLGSLAGVIKGKVTDGQTGQPLTGATVYLENTSYSTVVNLDGSFVFKRIPAGKYELKVSSVGYASPDDIAVDLSSKDQVTGIAIRMNVKSSNLEEVLVTASGQGSDGKARSLE